jgi:hypothetical protein
MPTGLATAFIAFGAILTTANETLGCVLAGVGVAIEFGRFYSSGLD